MDTRTNISKILLALIACGAVVLGPAAAAGDRAVSAKFAGSGFDTVVDPNQDGFPVQLTQARMQGTFGTSALAITTEWLIQPRRCPAGFDLPLAIVNSSLVITAPDQSQVFGFSQSGWMCVNTTTGAYLGEMFGIYNGGVGRYAGATGEWTAKFDGATLDPSIGFRSITGTVRGNIMVP